jgi:nucleoside-diphosphate-sugar epimerase
MVANGLSGLTDGRTVYETDASPAVGPDSDRGGSENLALSYAERGIRSMAIRFAPTVHGAGDWGFITFLVDAARRQGVSGYIGDGSTVWSAVHRDDAARLVRLGLESAPAGTRLHAVAEQEITTREIATLIAQAYDLDLKSVAPTEATAHFGFVGHFFALSMTASNNQTRKLLNWTPTAPTLAEDLTNGAYGNAD